MKMREKLEKLAHGGEDIFEFETPVPDPDKSKPYHLFDSAEDFRVQWRKKFGHKEPSVSPRGRISD